MPQRRSLRQRPLPASFNSIMSDALTKTDRPTQEQVDALRWFHSIDFGNGVVAKGAKDPDLLNREANVIFRHGVEEKSVLDIGAWDGFFSFEALRRGARAVTAVDGFIWADKGWGSRRPFDLGNAANGNRVTARIADVMV